MPYTYECKNCKSRSKKPDFDRTLVIRRAQSHANKNNHILDVLFKDKHVRCVFPTNRKEI